MGDFCLLSVIVLIDDCRGKNIRNLCEVFSWMLIFAIGEQC